MQFVVARGQMQFALSMGVDSTDLRSAFRPWVKNHPYGAWIDSYDPRPVARTGPYNLLLRVEPSELELTESAMVAWVNQDDAKRWADSKRLLVNHSDPVYRDFILRYRAGLLGGPDGDKQNGATAELLRSVSPWTSTFIAMLIHVDGVSMDKEAAQLERDYAADPIVLSELANRHLEMKRFDDAERCLNVLLRIDPRFDAYWRLATIFKTKGDMPRWKETLEKSLELSSGGLDHAQVLVALAEYHMQQNELDPALRYAKAAAQSYSGDSLMTLARCYELRQEWDEADQVMRAVAQRYREQTLEWMFFCAQRTRPCRRGRESGP